MLKYLRSICAILVLIATAHHAFAEFIGITQDEFKPHYRRQAQTMWCWASSAEMVLSFQGVELQQDKIVQLVTGGTYNAPGSLPQMVSSTNGVIKDIHGKSTVVSGQFVLGWPLPTVLFNQLKQKKPVILTFQNGPGIGHAVVLTGVDASVGANGVTISKYHFFDPFSYSAVPTPFGMNFLTNDALIYQSADLMMTPGGLIMLGKGVVTGAIFMNGSTL